MEDKKEVEIDTNLYSRQIGTFGMEAMGKLVKMNTAIVGLRGLGVEVAKNLILAGPASVTLSDDTLVQIGDLGANFYCEEQHVGKVTRAAACVQKLSELNPYVKVKTVSASDLVKLVKGGELQVVCQTELLIDGEFGDPEPMDALCTENNCGYIMAACLGPWGFTFLDYGAKHVINDANGEATRQFVVSFIKKGETTEVTVHEDKRHTYEEGDFVALREVEGMTEINGLKPAKVLKTTPFTFVLELDSSGFADYTRQGVCEDVKVPKESAFHSWADSFKNPQASSETGELMMTDFGKFGRSEQLHVALFGILAFVQSHKKYPTEADVAACLESAKAALATSQLKSFGADIEIAEDVFKNAVRFSSCSISPMAAFFGGVVAQEIVKKTGKYTPLKQWLHHDIFEGIPREETVNREPMNCRYDDQIRIYGREVQEKLKKVKTFMIGAGALGCELIKAFAVMGVGCSEEGLIHCTDNDNIEVSNLNRQFLFRQQNVGKAKSATACAIAKEMNPALNVKDYQKFVSPDTEDFFNDEFWESLSFVVGAVDNIKARLYVDQRCVWYEKALFESGTLGTKANSQMVMPHVTQCYGDSQDPAEESIPMCTLRNFPNLIEHCIEWGRDKFNGLFVDGPSDLVAYLDNTPAFMHRMKTTETTSTFVSALSKNIELIKFRQKADFGLCVAFAKTQFNQYFDYAIRDLLHTFPKDAKDKEGNPFWSGPKRAPTAVTFDASNPQHINFIVPAANLIAVALGLPECRDVTKITDMAATAEVAAYVQKTVKIEEEKKDGAQPAQPQPAAPEAIEDDKATIEKLMVELEGIVKSGVTKEGVSPAEFEKDDDSNFHIDFINAAANLRATNYEIKNCDRNKTKMIAGKIIPAIATTTAMITGQVTSELYKVVQGYTTLEDMRNSFINLALPLFALSEPMPVTKITDKDYDPIAMAAVKSIPGAYTIYDKITIDEGSMTVQQLFDWLDKKYAIEVYLLACGDYSLYNGFLPGNKHKARLDKKIEDIFHEIDGGELPAHKKYLIIVPGGTIKESGDDFQIAPLKYVFRK